MQTITTVSELRAHVRCLKRQGKSIGFVPSMGYLHAGHLSLVHLAREKADQVFVSIFVNPTQFNDPKDYEKYPIDLKQDTELLEKAQVDVLFVPTRESIYGGGTNRAEASTYQSWVTLDYLTSEHEGACRPGHFKGVSTVVAILFNLVQPDFAVFGEKDFQQLRIIEQMVADLKYDIEIVRGALIREADGLAMSSRNVRLSKEARQAALLLNQGLKAALVAYQAGEKDAAKLCALVEKKLASSSLIKKEYVKAVDEVALKDTPTVKANARIILAAFVDGVRLIDNLALLT